MPTPFALLRIQVPIAPQSYLFSPSSSFTACVHTVAIGYADMCWADFWQTSERLQMSTFSPAFDQDPIFIVMNASSSTASNTFWQTLIHPFEPFTPALWALIFVSFGFVGITLTYENRPQETKVNWWDFFFAEAPLGALKGFFAYTTGGDITSGIEFHTSGSWVTAFFMGFSAFVLMTGYGAVVTTTLITQHRFKINSLEDVVDQHMLVCTYDQLLETFVNRHPELGPLLVATPGSDLLNAIDRDECEAALIYESHWHRMRMFHQEQYCYNGPSPKVTLPARVAGVGLHIPVRLELLGAVARLLVLDVEAGVYEQMTARARLNYTFGVCPEPAIETEIAQFGVDTLGGPLVLLLLAATASIFVTRVGRLMHQRKQQMLDQLDLDGDGVVSADELSFAITDLTRRVSGVDYTTGGASASTTSSRTTEVDATAVKTAKEEENADAQLDTDNAAMQQAHTLEQLAASVRELSASVQQVKGRVAAGKRRANE